MTGATAAIPPAPSRAATGISGFDALSLGGLPRHRTSLLVGGPGSGKTVFALQTLVNAAREQDEPGVFVAFEERPPQLAANAATFDWDLPALARDRLYIFDAHLSPTVVRSGGFDLGRMLAILDAKVRDLGATRIVFDGIDVLLGLLRDPHAEMQELYRVRDWLADHRLTAIITAKSSGDAAAGGHYDFMQFMVDCVVRFDQRLEYGVPLRRLRITKSRGSDFVAGEFPFRFGAAGMHVTAPDPAEIRHAAPTDRVSTGFGALDTMLGGGLFRGGSTLISGAPGTSKTTLAGLFAEAACVRGERVLFVSFDEGPDPIVRNLASVGIRLADHVGSGVLRMYSGRTGASSAESHLASLRALLEAHRPDCMVIDPLSALAKMGGLDAARNAASRLIYAVKDQGITVVITSLVDGEDPGVEATDLQISTIADTWIHLSYLVLEGERNRALTIVKSRGTWHSNQVRELVLGDAGPTLTEVYSAGGEVLMGTLRREKEVNEDAARTQRRAQYEHRQRELRFAEVDARARIAALELDLERRREELALHAREDVARTVSSDNRDSELRTLCGTGAAAGVLHAGAGPGNGKTPPEEQGHAR